MEIRLVYFNISLDFKNLFSLLRIGLCTNLASLSQNIIPHFLIPSFSQSSVGCKGKPFISSRYQRLFLVKMLGYLFNLRKKEKVLHDTFYFMGSMWHRSLGLLQCKKRARLKKEHFFFYSCIIKHSNNKHY